MSNNFITPNALAGEALNILTGNLVVAPLFNNDIQENFAKTPKIGDQVTIIRRSILKPVNRAKGSAITVQNIDETSIKFLIQKDLDNSCEVDDQDATLSIPEGELVRLTDIDNYLNDRASRVVQPLALGMVQELESSLLAEVANVPSTYPTVATSALPNTVTQFSEISKMLSKMKVPMQGRNAIVNEDVYHSMLSLLETVNASGNSDALRDNLVNRLAGFNVYSSQYFSDDVHTTGTIGTATVQANTLKGVSTLVLDGTDEATGTFKAGDTLTIAGYGEVVVSSDATAVANVVTVSINEPLREDILATTAVSNYGVTGGVAISYKVVGFFGVSDCIAFASIAPIAGGTNIDSASVNAEGYGINVLSGFDMKQRAFLVSMSSLFGTKMIDGRLGVKLVQVVA